MKYVQKYNIITPEFGGASAPPSTYLSTALPGKFLACLCMYTHILTRKPTHTHPYK